MTSLADQESLQSLKSIRSISDNVHNRRSKFEYHRTLANLWNVSFQLRIPKTIWHKPIGNGEESLIFFKFIASLIQKNRQESQSTSSHFYESISWAVKSYLPKTIPNDRELRCIVAKCRESRRIVGHLTNWDEMGLGCGLTSRDMLTIRRYLLNWRSRVGQNDQVTQQIANYLRQSPRTRRHVSHLKPKMGDDDEEWPRICKKDKWRSPVGHSSFQLPFKAFAVCNFRLFIYSIFFFLYSVRESWPMLASISSGCCWLHFISPICVNVSLHFRITFSFRCPPPSSNLPSDICRFSIHFGLILGSISVQLSLDFG